MCSRGGGVVDACVCAILLCVCALSLPNPLRAQKMFRVQSILYPPVSPPPLCCCAPLLLCCVVLCCVVLGRLPIFFSTLVSTGVKRVDMLFLPQQRKLDDLIAQHRKDILSIKSSTQERRGKRHVVVALQLLLLCLPPPPTPFLRTPVSHPPPCLHAH
jgi:hypothetical protein